MSSEIIASVAYDNYDDFQCFNFIFSQNFISLFWWLINDKIDLRVSYAICLFHKCPSPRVFAGVKLNLLLTSFKKLVLWYPMGANQVSTGYHASKF
jgi:hypothetical protein